FVDAIKDLYTKTLNGRTPSELSNSELGVLLNQINALISEGVLERSEFQEQQKQNNEELDNIAEEAADTVSTVEEQNKIDETSLKQKLISAGKLVSSLKIYMIENWNTLTDIAFNLKGIDASAILKILNADDAMEMSSELRAKFIDEYRAKAMEALGVTKDTAYQKQMIRDQKQVNIGAKQKADGLRDSDTYTFTKKNGAEIERTLTYSKAEIRYLYMVHANEKSHGGLYSEKGNKLTKEMTDSLFAELNETDKALIEARFEIYRKLFPMYNKIFKGLNGEDLKAVEGLYSPWLRDGAIPSEKEYAFVEEDVLRAGIDPKSAIGRVALSEVKFKKVGDESVMQHHISDVSHYIGTAEKMTEIRRIIGNEKLKDAMNSRFGPSLHKALLHASENMVRGRIKAGNDLDNFINTSNSLFASAVLRGKISILAKQLLSIPAYLEHISVIDLAAGMLHFGAHPREAIKTLNEITSIRKRARNPEKAIANIGEQNAFIKRKLQGNPTVNKLLDANIHIGDIGAIYAGGWAVYRAARNGKLIGGKGVKLSHEQALVKVRDATKARQQSTDLNILSSLQTGNALERALTQFATAPLSYLRAEFEAVRHSPLPIVGRNKISYYQAGRKFAIYHFLLPIIWQIVADGFDIEEKHVYRAAILGNFNTIPIIGDLTHNAITIIMDQVTDKKTEKVYELDPITYYSAVNQFGHGIADVIQGGFNMDAEEFYDGVKGLSFAAGKFSGKPVETFYNIFEGVNDTTEKGFTKDSTLQSLGWPPVKETKKKKSDLFKVRQFK
ncbi:MAG: hypothetical protein GY928_27835, partial [Colwellia sp.]|nr:hypothetical protein [Colwellia sp.]